MAIYGNFMDLGFWEFWGEGEGQKEKGKLGNFGEAKGSLPRMMVLWVNVIWKYETCFDLWVNPYNIGISRKFAEI